MTDTIRYIDTDVVGGLGDGTSWANAYSSMAAWSAAEAATVASGDRHLAYFRGATTDTASAVLDLPVDGWTGSGELHLIGDLSDNPTSWDASKYVWKAFGNNQPFRCGLGSLKLVLSNLQRDFSNNYVNVALNSQTGGADLGDIDQIHSIDNWSGNPTGNTVTISILGADAIPGTFTRSNCLVLGSLSQDIFCNYNSGGTFNTSNTTIENIVDDLTIVDTTSTINYSDSAIGGVTTYLKQAPTFTNCATEAGVGTNPVTVSDWDLEFTDAANDDFSLLATSQLLGAGSTSNNIGVDQTTEAANQAPVADSDTFSIFTNAQVGDVVGTVPVSDSDGTVDNASMTGTNFDIDTAGEITVISTSGLSVGTITEDATFTDNDGDSTVVTITINVTAPQLAISSVSSYSVAANANFTVSYNNADAAISAFITLNNTDYALTKVSDTNGVATFTAPFLPDFGDFTANFDTDSTVNITDGTTTTQFPQAFRVQKIAAATDTIGVITTPSPVGDYKDVVGDPSGATSYRQSLTGDSSGDIATGVYTVTQAASARYRLYDGVWGDWFTVNYPAPVEAANQAPTANAQTFSIQDDAANNSQIGQFVASDSDGTIDGDGYSSSNPSVSITTGGILLLADNSGLTAGTPLTGTISFRDNDGATGSANFTVNVTAAPVQATPPSARPDSPIPATLYVKVSEPYPLAQHVLNPDGAALSYAVAQNSPALPANVSLNASTGQLSTTDNSYTPVEDLEIEVLLA